MTEDATVPGDATPPGDATAPSKATPPDESAPGGPVDGETSSGSVSARDRFRALRWPVLGVAAFLALMIVFGVVVSCGALRLGATADAQSRAATRVDTACLAMETRLDRLSPPGAATNPDARATAIRYENIAVEPFLSELDRLEPEVKRYEPLRSGWQQLVDARERFAADLDVQAQTGRPAFFVFTSDTAGRDRVKQLLVLAPDSCDGTVRRLTAPDL